MVPVVSVTEKARASINEVIKRFNEEKPVLAEVVAKIFLETIILREGLGDTPKYKCRYFFDPYLLKYYGWSFPDSLLQSWVKEAVKGDKNRHLFLHQLLISELGIAVAQILQKNFNDNGFQYRAFCRILPQFKHGLAAECGEPGELYKFSDTYIGGCLTVSSQKVERSFSIRRFFGFRAKDESSQDVPEEQKPLVKSKPKDTINY